MNPQKYPYFIYQNAIKDTKSKIRLFSQVNENVIFGREHVYTLYPMVSNETLWKKLLSTLISALNPEWLSELLIIVLTEKV